MKNLTRVELEEPEGHDTGQKMRPTVPDRYLGRWFRRMHKLSAIALITAMLTVLFVASPVSAHHECDWYGTKCDVLGHGISSKSVTDWTPTRHDTVGPRSWYVALASNTGTYQYTYASGGRELDNYAQWDFNSAMRGIYKIWVRIPEGGQTASGLRRPATATVLYNVYIRENGENKNASSFLIDQRRQQGWVDSGEVLLLRSSDRVTITISDEAAWPDIAQAGSSNSRIAVDAIHLSHEGILLEDLKYARLECAARTPEGREIELAKEIDHITPAKYGSLALSVGTTGLGTVISANPVGIGAIIGLSLADPIASLVYGEGIFDALAGVSKADRQLDIASLIYGASFGGTVRRADGDVWSIRWERYFTFSDPGPCEKYETWEQYLPAGA